jgi:hypothetical protein
MASIDRRIRLRHAPSGIFRPFRMEIDHYSEEWDNALVKRQKMANTTVVLSGAIPDAGESEGARDRQTPRAT